jgi:hypothetical protein
MALQPGFQSLQEFGCNWSKLLLPDNSRLNVIVDSLAPDIELGPVLINEEADEPPSERIIQSRVPGNDTLEIKS